jgi:hypothetical protein
MFGVIIVKKKYSSSWIVELGTLWYVGFQPFFLVCYFLKFDEFIFSLQDTYNSRLNERYEDDPSTYLDLDRNRVYGLCNIMAENL